MEIAREVSHATGCCLQLKDFAPRWIVIRTLSFFIATSLAVFDTYTDWVVVFEFEKHGIENPLIVYDQNWVNAWYFFTVVGTILTAATISHDVLNLAYPMFICCSRCCSKPCFRRKKSQMDVNLLDESGVSEGETEGEGEKGKEPKDEKVTDPCKCCYRWGFNVVTRNENLAILHLWFQNIPLVILGILYVLTLATCERPDAINKDKLSDHLLHVGISIFLSMLASTYRLIRSSYRMFESIGVRVKGTYFCKRLLPKKAMDAVYPPDTRCQVLVFPYYFGLILQWVVINLMGFGAFMVWIYYLVNKVGPSDNSTLGVFITLERGVDTRLFDIYSDLIEPDTPYFTFTAITDKIFSFEPIYCLSEFEYDNKTAQIYYNTAQIRVVSPDGSFCNASYEKDIHLKNFDNCDLYFTDSDYNLYYASGEPGTSSFTRFDQTCILFTDSFFLQTPKADFNIKPHKVVNTTGFPKHGEELLIYSPPPVNLSFSFMQAVTSHAGVTLYFDPTIGYIYCIMYFRYNYDTGVLSYSYIEMYNYEKPDCSCTSQYATRTTCKNLGYAYNDTHTQQLVELNSCYTLPEVKVRPVYVLEEVVDIPCPCDLKK